MSVFGSDCVIVIFNLITFFPKPDTAVSNWKSSRQDLSVPLGSQHNKFCCYLLNCCTTYHPSYNIHCFRSAIFFSTWESIICQLPTFGYNNTISATEEVMSSLWMLPSSCPMLYDILYAQTFLQLHFAYHRQQTLSVALYVWCYSFTQRILYIRRWLG